MKTLLICLMILPAIFAGRIQLLDITPEEAQKYIAAQGLDLIYARKLGENPLPSGRSIDGKNYYHHGRLIENPQDYIEQTYEASQFHGQDGLGRVMFGYNDWNQARLEARNANGEVRGSYQYVDPLGENYVVQYWSDGLGFHQTDNRPKIVLEPVTDTPEVKAARVEHERAWREAARASKVNPDPNSNFYNRNANKYDDEQAEQEQAQELISGVANQAQGLTRYPTLPYTKPIAPQGAFSHHDSVVVEAPEETRTNLNYDKSKKYEEEDYVTSEPRGFFYSFDYPVSILVENQSKKLAKRSDEVAAPDSVKDEVETVKTDENAEAPQLARISLKATQDGAIPIDAVHDAQVHPLQKGSVDNSQVLPVYLHD